MLLELETEFIENIARQAGFEFRLEDQERRVVLELSAEGRQAPLLLFDAADPGNLGWFSRCQFYVDGTSGVCRSRKNCRLRFACPTRPR
jgi:hypothetical protein